MVGSIPTPGTPEGNDGPHRSAQTSQTHDEKGQDSEQEKNPSVDTAVAPESSPDTSAKTLEAPEPEQNDDKQPDYSSKSQNKVSFSHYLVIETSVPRYGSRGLTYLTEDLHVFYARRSALYSSSFPGANWDWCDPTADDRCGLTGDFTSYFAPGSTTTKAEFMKGLNKSTLYFVYLFIARWILSYYSMFAFRMTGIRMSAKLRLEYLKALFSLPISAIDTLPSGQASNTITTTANVLQIGISEKLGIIVQFTSLLVASIIIAFITNPLLTVVTASIIPFMGITYGVLVPIIMARTKDVEHADEKAASIAGEVLGSIRMIIACGAEDRIAKRYSGWIEESRKRGIKLAPFLGMQFAPMFFAIYATMALCFWFGFKLYLEHRIADVGEIVIVLMSVMMASFSISQTAAPIMAVGKANSAATDFFAVIDAPKPGVTGMRDPEVSASSDIALDGVTFAYPSRPHIKVLDDLNIRFESGKITAIVGASGSGKSTIVGLLERWYELDNEKIFKLPESAMKDDKDKDKDKDKENKEAEPEEPTLAPISLGGNILIGGQNLDAVDLKWWRSQIGLVQQEPFIFNDTISRNVEYGLIGSQWEGEDAETKKMLVEEACKEAFADEFINRLPLGYDTQVGDAGIKISGGQRQRLAIARSIIKRPKILILDEATSSIDVRGERLVQQALDRVSEGRTTITIAHRLSTIKKADKIVVLKKGKVIEQGNHDSLLEDENGAYWALVNAQKLSMGETFEDESDLTEDSKPGEVLERTMTAGSAARTAEEEVVWKDKPFLASFATLMAEQTGRWPWYLILAISCLSAGAGNPIQAYLFAQLINVVTYVGAALQAATNYWALRFFILSLGVLAAYFLLGYSSSTISTHITCTYRQEYFESILAKPVSFFDDEDNSSGTLTARVANDPTQLQQLLGINMAMVYIAIFGLVGCVIIGFVFGWKLTLLTTLVPMPLMMAGAFFRIRYEVQFEKLNQAVFAESSKFAAEAIGAFRTVTSLTLEDMISERYGTLLQDHVNKAFIKSRYSTLIFSLSDSFGLLSMALTFWYGGKLLADREYDAVQFFVVYIAVINGAESAGSLLSFGPNIAQASAAANRILSFRIRQNKDAKEPLEIPDAEGGVKIELRDLWFKYPTRDIPIFHGLNLTIEKGQFAALVGPSGCGKTSIVSLLERFYDVQKGKIMCNNANIADLPTSSYRKLISLVAQEPTLFQGTIKENILLGVDESTPTATLHQVCRDAEIHDFIMSLPEGYNTDVGTKGIALSGGQKQRIAIARALIRDPKMLLLDEATSSLDSESEKLVQAAFERAGKGRTMVVVAHRLATVQNADVIFVLGEGKVLEQGDHQSLLKRRGVYYQMCQSQALDR
ncbi:putative leptomycin B resistance protein pmd1 [Venustampulla echinocandica]|uniref:Putative leptomycin B resistance protein pmd1 n=1 Tax=Venustampulla echinocandica TaxID=2656787 RepID=A0A370TMJ4_9HELO|nr:putative leptomycin B resistance protein pmd1 [Venustampulla echinocandica]RDL36738.1 putative leptomycin B resistance protein pmd1 [Venustampulla echinocandica]